MPTFQEIISGDGGVRSIINDTNPSQYRYSDADLMGYANDGLLAAATLRPDLFSVVGEISCTASTTVQRLTTTGAMQLLDIFNVKNGRAVTETTRDKHDRFNSLWRVATPAAAENWMRDPRSALGFFVYPPALAGQVLIGEWVQAPATYAIGDEIPIPYNTALKDYIVFRAEARDDDHVNSQRAVVFYQSFERGLGVVREAPSGSR